MRMNPYSTLITPKAGSLFHAEFHPNPIGCMSDRFGSNLLVPERRLKVQNRCNLVVTG
jgi:hypothetical protein